MNAGIAIVGMGCRYPDAQSPAELWETVLARRRAFRRIPAERLRLEDYREAAAGGLPGVPAARGEGRPIDPGGPADSDSINLEAAAVLAGWDFDRVRFQVAGPTFRTADLTHWLALEVADQALADAGFDNGAGLPRDATGVLLGNSLTGEFSRAQLLRLRWPYVRRVLAAGLAAEGWAGERLDDFLARLEATYKAPFPRPNEESLAGGLSNTIAGRICNHYDLRGGGYTVDGACASSLLAVAQACTALVAGDLDVALAGGVDLSLDPFELVGFARLGALAVGEMRIYDARSAGFTPGEGCGFVVLMRERQARAWSKRIHALIRGWGVSSDGHGGISRPEAAGQRLAFTRAYRRAGFGIETVSYFEGHGTGTPVGDATELAALSQSLREARAQTGAGDGNGSGAAVPAPVRPPPAIGSIKANIGHTKAAAGIAGLIKATLAVESQLLPPTTGCEEPHAELAGADPMLRALAAGEAWPADRPLRAGVSAMGFGGVNAHLVVEGLAAARRHGMSARERVLLAPPQDAELLPLAGADAAELAALARRLAGIAPQLSRSELGDLAGELHRRLGSAACGSYSPGAARPAAATAARAAIVAGSPDELADRAGLLVGWLDQGVTRRLDPRQGVLLGISQPGEAPPRVGLLFTGQGSPAYAGSGRQSGAIGGQSGPGPGAAGGALGRRFPDLAALYDLAARLTPGRGRETDPSADTAVAQPAIVAHCLAGLWLLEQLGVSGSVAVGHSLGEIAALHWAGACDADAALRLAAARGRAMAEQGEPGAMASLPARATLVEELIAAGGVSIAAYNGAARTVVSGAPAAVAAVIERAAARGLVASQLKVARAFHSPLVAAAAADFDRALITVAWKRLRRPVASTVTGDLLAPDADLRALLLAQVTAPVRFTAALAAARQLAELWIEIGPGRALAELVGEELGEPALALDTGGPSLGGPWSAAAALFAAGLPVDLGCVFEGRFRRPFDLDRPLRFLANPCESAPQAPPAASLPRTPAPARALAAVLAAPAGATLKAGSPGAVPARETLAPIELLRGLVTARTELPPSAVRDDSRLLADLHLNSITVGQLVVEASRQLGLAPPVSPTDYAQATMAEVALALAERAHLEPDAQDAGAGGLSAPHDLTPGVDTWVRPFNVDLVERPLAPLRPPATPSGSGDRAKAGGWQVIASPGHPLAPAIATALAALAPLSVAAATGEPPGILLCLPADLDESDPVHLELFVAAARAVTGTVKSSARRFVLVQHGGGGGGFARTLHLELPAVATWVIDLPTDAEPAAAAAWVAAEVLAAVPPANGEDGSDALDSTSGGYVEAHFDARGTRRVPMLRLLAVVTDADRQPPVEAGPAVLGQRDVLLVTGGGKGIGAECALALVRVSGARLAILGRSDPETDPELAGNLARMAAAGVHPLYLRADAGDPDAVQAAVAHATAELGPVTALLHAAGVNTPRRLADLDGKGLRQTLVPKVAGARNLLAALAVGPDRLRLVIGFGSIIARIGLRGEADYALANEWLARLLERFAVQHPTCRCLVLDWSVWSGVGMGERLGTLEALARQGIVPISPDAGVAELQRLLGDPAVRGRVVVASRFGDPPTLAVERPELPLLRFLETPRVYYPGIELVVDTVVSADSDPYLADHVFRGEPLFAAVVGLEAMAQVAAAVTGAEDPPVFEQVELRRPVAVTPGRSATLRLAALVRAPGLVEVALRDSSTGFATDHFRAVCRFGPAAAELAEQVAAGGSEGPADATRATAAAGRLPAPAPAAAARRLPIDPPRDLYGGILFHTGRFIRLGGYRRLRATECLAEIIPDGLVRWFGRYLPAALLLGDPAARDAAIHAIQACIPHAQLLPIGVERIVTGRLPTDEPMLLAARERRRDGDTFVYDLDILGADCSLRERWLGLRLRAVDRTRRPAAWIAPLLAPYLERRLQELLPGSNLRIALEAVGRAAAASAVVAEDAPDVSNPPLGRSDSASVVERLVASVHGPAMPRLTHRPDGRPEILGGPQISVSHTANLVLAVTQNGRGGRIGCDLESIVDRPAETWRDLLGAEGYALAELISRQRGERPAAATRVWTAAESLHKAGSPAGAPLLLEAALDDGWLLLRSGDLRVASFTAAVRELGGSCAFAVVAADEAPRSTAAGSRPAG